MKQTRIGVFETNSSSTHSIRTVKGMDMLETVYPDEDGVLRLRGDEFGWGWERHNDALTKLNYCATYYALYCPDYLPNFEEIIKEHTGIKTIENLVSEDWGNENYAYIDHQSRNVIKSDPEWLINFIFNPEVELVIGNDNGSPPINFYVDKPEDMNYEIVLHTPNEKKIYVNDLEEINQYNLRSFLMVKEYDFRIKNNELFGFDWRRGVDGDWEEYERKICDVTVLQQR